MDRAKVDAFLDRFVELASRGDHHRSARGGRSSRPLRHLGEVGGGTAGLAEGAELRGPICRGDHVGIGRGGHRRLRPGREALRSPTRSMRCSWPVNRVPTSWVGSLTSSLRSSPRSMEWRPPPDGGGVRFEEYGEAAVRGIARAHTAAQNTFLVSRWLPAAPGLTGRLEKGIRVADVGCGSGTAAILMARAFPQESDLRLRCLGHVDRNRPEPCGPGSQTSSSTRTEWRRCPPIPGSTSSRHST